jgi:ATP-dependent helicase/nuclease subunit B
MASTSPSRIVRVSCALHELLARAAAAIVERERGSLPDLAHVVVLIPDLHAAADVAHALRAAADLPALLLPRIATLDQWAADVPLDRPVASRAAREVLLYQELARRNWLASADLWAVSAELTGLFDEMTRHHVALPADFATFNRKLEQAYRARAGSSLTFEARIVHELWHAMARVTGEVDVGSAYPLRLARLADTASAPLYALALSTLAPVERAFLERYAERAPVATFEANCPGADDPLTRTLVAAWPHEPGQALALRAAQLRNFVTESPLATRVRVVPVATAEAEARALDAIVREWLAAGRRRIAVVVQDRVVARRARALLERAEVLVKDEAGWAFSTTSAATVIGRVLDVVSNDGYHRDLLDLMKSPFAFHDLPRDARQRTVWRFEQRVRRRGTVSGVNAFLAQAAQDGDADVRGMLERVASACRAFGRRTHTLTGWLAALDDALEAAGIAGGLQRDAAGAELLDFLGDLRGELDGDGFQVGFGEWRRWLARKIEGAIFRDRAIASPVVFTHLAAMRLRSFDGVIIAGGDAAHLPGPDPLALFFNQAVRAELGLPTRADELRDVESRLIELIAASSSVTVTWQRTRDGEENLLSPFLQRLETLHRCAWNATLVDDAFEARLSSSHLRSPSEAVLPEPTEQPRPLAPPPLIPSGISASGYNALVACPYQFHARHVLGLSELDEVQEEIEKSGYGQCVHSILARFHRAHPVVSTLGAPAATETLTRYSEQAFREVIAANFLDAAWLARWKALIPEYVEWQIAREAEGWRFAAGEVRREIEIITPAGRKLLVRGQLDRVDVQETASGALAAVIDYKTRSRKALEEAVATPGEDVQLPVYALLWGGPVAAAFFLSIDRDGVKPVVPDDDASEHADAVRARLAAIYDALHEGARLPAQGIDAVCANCEMRGLCRLDFWS